MSSSVLGAKSENLPEYWGGLRRGLSFEFYLSHQVSVWRMGYIKAGQ